MRVVVVVAGLVVACTAVAPQPVAPVPSVVFTYPADHQLDVPIGANVVVTFSDPVVATAALVAPDGNPVAATPTPTEAGTGLIFTAPALEPGTTYGVVVDGAPRFSFTTRRSAPNSAAPALIAIQGRDPALFATAPHRPMFETSTIHLVFSEPLDPRSIGSIALVDGAGAPVPAVVIANGIHVSIDPIDDLGAGETYTLELGDHLADLDGQRVAPAAFPLTPLASRTTVIPQILRTRGPGDPGPKLTRSGQQRNAIAIAKPLIGTLASTLNPAALRAELGDPTALGGPIAFTIRKGQRLSATGLDVELDGAIPSGLATGEIEIEILTDADGRMYRNPYHAADEVPDNQRSPIYVDLVLDLAIYAKDPGGNAVLAQTILGVEASGTAIATDGVLAIEAVAAMELGLLGIATAPSNFVMELITDPTAAPATDTEPPVLLASYPDHAGLPIAAGVELIFDEPIDLSRAVAGGVTLVDRDHHAVPTVIESHGAAIVVRPLAPLAYGAPYDVVLSDIADASGNATAPMTVAVKTEDRPSLASPATVTSVHPGAPCTLTDGRCTGGKPDDDRYHPFGLPANEAIEIGFTEPLVATTVVLGTTCHTGSVRVETFGPDGACTAVPGSLIHREHSLAFFPDVPWTTGATYRLSLISGPNSGCSAGELCGEDGHAASFDPLNGMATGDGGGNDLVVEFLGMPAASSTFMVAETEPGGDSRAALAIVGTSGLITAARFAADCVPETLAVEACMVMQGAIPVELGALATACPLPDGTTAPTCIPVTMTPAAMYASSMTMLATVLGLATLDTPTNTSVMRIREPAVGYIVDRDGAPTMIAALELYMDAPNLTLPLSTHDLHSKQLTIVLEGPLTFLADGRISIALTNRADVPIDVDIASVTSGQVALLLAKGQMKLQLVSRAIRGIER